MTFTNAHAHFNETNDNLGWRTTFTPHFHKGNKSLPVSKWGVKYPPYPITLTSPFNTQRVINTVELKLLSVF